MCVLAPSQKVLCPQTRNPWVLSCHHSGCTVSGDVLHRCCSAAWHGASQMQPGKVKKTPNPNKPNTPQNPTKAFWPEVGQEESQGKCCVVSLDLWCFFVCLLRFFGFFSAVTWVKRGTRVHKCDPLAQRWAATWLTWHKYKLFHSLGWVFSEMLLVWLNSSLLHKSWMVGGSDLIVRNCSVRLLLQCQAWRSKMAPPSLVPSSPEYLVAELLVPLPALMDKSVFLDLSRCTGSSGEGPYWF